MNTGESLNFFVSYSHEDQEWLQAGKYNLIPWLGDSLRGDGVHLWSDPELGERHVGDEWADIIRQRIAEADFVILLLSENFRNSRFITEHELPAIKQRYDAGEIAIIPILVDNIDWDVPENLEWITRLQIHPGGVPLIEYVNDKAKWSKVRLDLLKAIRLKIKAHRHNLRHADAVHTPRAVIQDTASPQEPAREAKLPTPLPPAPLPNTRQITSKRKIVAAVTVFLAASLMIWGAVAFTRDREKSSTPSGGTSEFQSSVPPVETQTTNDAPETPLEQSTPTSPPIENPELPKFEVSMIPATQAAAPDAGPENAPVAPSPDTSGREALDAAVALITYSRGSFGSGPVNPDSVQAAVKSLRDAVPGEEALTIASFLREAGPSHASASRALLLLKEVLFSPESRANANEILVALLPMMNQTHQSVVLQLIADLPLPPAAKWEHLLSAFDGAPGSALPGLATAIAPVTNAPNRETTAYKLIAALDRVEDGETGTLLRPIRDWGFRDAAPSLRGLLPTARPRESTAISGTLVEWNDSDSANAVYHAIENHRFGVRPALSGEVLPSLFRSFLKLQGDANCDYFSACMLTMPNPTLANMLSYGDLQEVKCDEVIRAALYLKSSNHHRDVQVKLTKYLETVPEAAVEKVSSMPPPVAYTHSAQIKVPAVDSEVHESILVQFDAIDVVECGQSCLQSDNARSIWRAIYEKYRGQEVASIVQILNDERDTVKIWKALTLLSYSLWTPEGREFADAALSSIVSWLWSPEPIGRASQNTFRESPATTDRKWTVLMETIQSGTLAASHTRSAIGLLLEYTLPHRREETCQTIWELQLPISETNARLSVIETFHCDKFAPEMEQQLRESPPIDLALGLAGVLARWGVQSSAPAIREVIEDNRYVSSNSLAWLCLSLYELEGPTCAPYLGEVLLTAAPSVQNLMLGSQFWKIKDQTYIDAVQKLRSETASDSIKVQIDKFLVEVAKAPR